MKAFDWSTGTSRHAVARYQLGAAYEDLGRTDEAVAEWLRAAKDDPTLAGAHYALARVYAERGQHDDALRSYRDAVAANPSLAEYARTDPRLDGIRVAITSEAADERP